MNPPGPEGSKGSQDVRCWQSTGLSPEPANGVRGRRPPWARPPPLKKVIPAHTVGETVFYEKILKELNRAGVRYVVAGGIAVNLHGVPRATADLDLLIEMSPSNVRKLVNVMRKVGYLPRIPVGWESLTLENLQRWKKEKHMRAITFRNPKVPYEEVDVILEHSLDMTRVLREKKLVKAGDLRIPLISLDHLITLKRRSKRLQDLADVKALQKLIKLRGG